jgi:hypothetical protein
MGTRVNPKATRASHEGQTKDAAAGRGDGDQIASGALGGYFHMRGSKRDSNSSKMTFF